MSRKNIPLLCYCDGKISHDSQGITFEDAIPKASKVNSGIKYSGLIDKIYELMGIDCQRYKVRIICRYLANGKYIALPIDNDELVEIMLDMTKEKGINCVELYIEKSATAGDEGEEPITTTDSYESSADEGEEPATTTDSSERIFLNVKTQVGKERLYRMRRDQQLQRLMTAVCEGHQLRYKESRFFFRDEILREWNTPNEHGLRDYDEISVCAVSD